MSLLDEDIKCVFEIISGATTAYHFSLSGYFLGTRIAAAASA